MIDAHDLGGPNFGYRLVVKKAKVNRYADDPVTPLAGSGVSG